ERDAEGIDREVEPRALGLRHVGQRAPHGDVAAPPRRLSEQRAKQCRLTAAVRPEDRDRAPTRDVELDTAHRRDALDVARGEAADLQEGGAHVAASIRARTRAWERSASAIAAVNATPPIRAIAAPGGTSNS